MKGKTITLYVEESETVASLKDRISQQEHIDARFFRLHAGGRPLDPMKPLGHYNIAKQSSIHMAVALSATPVTEQHAMVINIIAQQGADQMVYQLGFDNPSSTTVGFLKLAIGERYNLPTEDYVLCGHRASREEVTEEAWLSEALCETTTISEYGILDGHWLILRARTASGASMGQEGQTSISQS